ncbi:hypothetical protein COT77_01310 [Candidatus Berkelbacteria bacterium CG10_big_fil_rev_8_21_14_0_10_41_12]|uniref:DUF2304 domain-containing protein n=1 Tax=Candidatus Berkelbacteria bacterium CG10_big_fil_rev_8_21_14_0_10_41_12 TaxID=1974513 RepID=A0A2M6WXE1_9BACT|nr:MAG: hypothetical protein COT77_01310 [Candidatus Berkelbacteria bacterium CG10_big_fil_rev_8_21_14_0_10_41_12]
MLIFAKVFAILLAVLVIARSLTDYKNKKESIEMTIFWVIIWTSIIVFAFSPSLIDKLITKLGGSRTGLGTIFGMGLVFVLFISYRIYIKANRIEKNLDLLSRNYTLLELEHKKKRRKRR